MVATIDSTISEADTVMNGRVIVVGLGRTGLSCVRYLRAGGRRVVVTDDRLNPPELDELRHVAPEVEVRLGGFDHALLADASEVVLSPGVDPRQPFVRAAVERNLPIAGDIELFARAARAPIVAVTGTNGKSTATTLVAEMAARAGRTVLAGGNLGCPALDLLGEPVPELYVLELSSFQLETTRSLHTVSAAVLNVTADHLDRYASIEEYAAAKARIFNNCGVAVINRDDPRVRRMPVPGQSVVGFSVQTDPGAEYCAVRERSDIALVRRGRRLVAMGELRITGLHNAANALAALALGETLGLAEGACLEALRGFRGLPHRSQWVADRAGVRWVDDSKGTNVGATIAAVAGMSGPLVLIGGGDGKGQDFEPLADAFRGKVRHAILIGRDARRLAGALAGACPIEFAPDLDDAVARAARIAQPGDTVLLSPACASLDMFRDYAERGDVFAAAVQRLAS